VLVDPFEIAQTLSPSFFVLVSQENRCNAFKCDRWRGNAGRLTYWGFLDLQLKAMAMFITVCSCVHYCVFVCSLPKTRRGGHVFKILYWMYTATRGPNVKWWGTDFTWGDRAPLAPPLATGLVFITVCSCVHYCVFVCSLLYVKKGRTW